MGDATQPNSSALNFEPWELELVRTTAARIRTTEREELESELALHLLHVKRRHRVRVRHWKAYLTAALRNKATNWIRDRQRHERDLTDLDAPVTGDEDLTREDLLSGSEAGHDLRTAFAAVWEELDPELRKVWEVLLQENGNQVQVAKRLKKHRNTVRLWIHKIQAILQRHGFGERR